MLNFISRDYPQQVGDILARQQGSQNAIDLAVRQLLSSHQQQVSFFRKEFKELSKEDFRKLSNDPNVKEILVSSKYLTAQEKAERIREHLKAIK